MFGATDVPTDGVCYDMQTDYAERAIEGTEAPSDWPSEVIDVRTLGPPKPLTETLETLADLDDRSVLVQANDRAPQHLYPKLEDRGYRYETVEGEDVTLTAIWQEE